MRQTKSIALCGVTAALATVIQLIGGMLGLGTYASPMLAGLCLLPAGEALGKKPHILLWLCVSALSFLLVPDVEQNLMFLCLFGCYPILRPLFQRLPKALCLLCKFLFVNLITIALEALVLFVLVPEPMSIPLMLILLVLGNITFFCYDLVLPRVQQLLSHRLAAFLRK